MAAARGANVNGDLVDFAIEVTVGTTTKRGRNKQDKQWVLISWTTTPGLM